MTLRQKVEPERFEVRVLGERLEAALAANGHWSQRELGERRTKSGHMAVNRAIHQERVWFPWNTVEEWGVALGVDPNWLICMARDEADGVEYPAGTNDPGLGRSIGGEWLKTADLAMIRFGQRIRATIARIIASAEKGGVTPAELHALRMEWEQGHALLLRLVNPLPWRTTLLQRRPTNLNWFDRKPSLSPPPKADRKPRGKKRAAVRRDEANGLGTSGDETIHLCAAFTTLLEPWLQYPQDFPLDLESLARLASVATGSGSAEVTSNGRASQAPTRKRRPPK